MRLILPECWHGISLPLAENYDVCIDTSFHHVALLPQNRGCFGTNRLYQRNKYVSS